MIYVIVKGPDTLIFLLFYQPLLSPQLDIILSEHGQDQSYVRVVMTQANMVYKGGTSTSGETNGTIKQPINTDGEVREEKNRGRC